MVLNYQTGEIAQYVYLEEMPEEIRNVFEESLTEECLEDRTCYDKTMVIRGKVYFDSKAYLIMDGVTNF